MFIALNALIYYNYLYQIEELKCVCNRYNDLTVMLSRSDNDNFVIVEIAEKRDYRLTKVNLIRLRFDQFFLRFSPVI